MIRLEDFKKELGALNKELSELEILELRDNQDQLAEVFFSMWLSKIKAEENEVH